MANSITEIANRALDAVNIDSISSMDDTSKAGRLCNRLFPQLRDTLLRMHPWKFAKTRQNLAASGTTPAWGYAYEYQLPSDYVRMDKLNVTDPSPIYEVEGNKLLTDYAPPLGIVYIFRVTDVGRFDPLFSTALATLLAANLAKPLTNSDGLRKDLQAQFANDLREARSANAAEGRAQIVESDIFITARL